MGWEVFSCQLHMDVIKYQQNDAIKTKGVLCICLLYTSTANIKNTMSAAAKQQACIRYLVKENKFQSLSPALRMAAETRLAYPEATLEELGDLMEPRMGKSGVNHLRRKLVQL